MTPDLHHMRHALSLARSGLGLVGNARPSVGCVLVKHGVVIGAARTGNGGAPHGEANALEQAGAEARGATAFVTLEPCAHEGNTPSCAKSLMAAGVSRVVIACQDPDLRTNGAGIQILQDAGIEVRIGLMETEALELNRGFFLTVQHDRPLVTLKMAMTMDGKIALQNGESKWITGELARRYAHLERARHDAILVGRGTIEADNPSLTTRLPGLKHDGLRVILDSNLSLDLKSRVFHGLEDQPVLILHDKGISQERVTKIQRDGVTLGHVDLSDVSNILNILKKNGITRVLVEGGSKVHASFLRSGLVDRILVFRAPKVMGSDALSGVDSLDIERMSDVYGFKLQKTRRLGEDLLEIYAPKG